MLIQLAADALWRGSDSLPPGLLPTLDAGGMAEDCSLWKDSGSLLHGLVPGPGVKTILEGFKADEWLQEGPNGDSSNGTDAQACLHAGQALIVNSGAPSVSMSGACDVHTEACVASTVQATPARGVLQAGGDTGPSAATSGCNSQGSDEEYAKTMHADDDDAVGSMHSTGTNGSTPRTAKRSAKATLPARGAAAGSVKKPAAKGGRRASKPKSHASVQQRYRERQKAKTMELQEAREQLQDQAWQVDAMHAESAALKVSSPPPNAVACASGCLSTCFRLELSSHFVHSLQERLSYLELRVAVVDSQLGATSLWARTHPHSSQALPACPAINPIDFATPSVAPSPEFAMRLDSGGVAAVEHGGQHRRDTPVTPSGSWPPPHLRNKPPHPPRSPLGTFSSRNAVQATEVVGGARGPEVAVPTEASQLPEYLESTLSALQSFMVGLEASSDALVRPRCLPCVYTEHSFAICVIFIQHTVSPRQLLFVAPQLLQRLANRKSSACRSRPYTIVLNRQIPALDRRLSGTYGS